MPNNIKVTTVTPELAEEFLGKNTHNRNVRERHVRTLANEMQAGRWKFNGEPIRFGKDGVLLDGQHRLHAVIKSGIPQKMLIVTGIEGEAQHTMDTGSKRSTSDALKLRGEKNTVALAAGIRAVILWEKGVRNFASRSDNSGAVTSGQTIEYLDSHPEMREYTTEIVGIKGRINLTSSVLVLLNKVFSEIDSDDAAQFIHLLATGEGVKGDPTFELKRVLDREKYESTGKNETWKTAIAIKAWNKWRMGESVGALRYTPGGSNPEKFPEPI